MERSCSGATLTWWVRNCVTKSIMSEAKKKKQNGGDDTVSMRENELSENKAKSVGKKRYFKGFKGRLVLTWRRCRRPHPPSPSNGWGSRSSSCTGLALRQTPHRSTASTAAWEGQNRRWTGLVIKFPLDSVLNNGAMSHRLSDIHLSSWMPEGQTFNN